MRLSEDFLNELRFRNPIDEVISSYVVLKRSGSTLKGLCPFHNERTPSFTVYPNNGSYYCFGCQNGGDVITFIRSAENLDYIESVKMLADRCGLAMPDTGYDDSAEKLRRRILEINRETAVFFHKCLVEKKDNAIGLKYFVSRKLKGETINKFGLGYAPDSFNALRDYLKSKGYSENEMIIANVEGKSQKNGRAYDRFRKKVIFPIIDLRGNVIAFGGRKFPEDEGAKYINTSDTPVFKKSKNLYGLNFAKNSGSDTVLLTEGYMDTIALHQAGFNNAVGALGTSFTEDQALLLSKYFKEIIVTMDTDGPGQNATRRAIEILKKTGMKIRVLQVEGGKDPDEYIKTFGAERFRLLLEGAKNDIEFRLFAEKNKYDTKTEAGKLDYLKAAVNVLANQNDEIAINLYAGKLSTELGVDKSVLLRQIKQRVQRNAKSRTNKKIREIISPKYSANDVNKDAAKYKRAAYAEEMLLSILMEYPQYCDYVYNKIKPEDFLTEFNKNVFEKVKPYLAKDKEFNLSLVGEFFTPEQMGKIVEIQNRVKTATNIDKVIDDCIKVVFDEKDKLGILNPSTMNDDEFENAIKNLGKNKKG